MHYITSVWDQLPLSLVCYISVPDADTVALPIQRRELLGDKRQLPKCTTREFKCWKIRPRNAELVLIILNIHISQSRVHTRKCVVSCVINVYCRRRTEICYTKRHMSPIFKNFLQSLDVNSRIVL
jgi:hypothetical protein